MCRNQTLTFLLCKHSTNSTTCSTPGRRVLSRLGLTRACKPTTASISLSVNDFCTLCRAFFTAHHISAYDYRDLIVNFRVTRGYHGVVTPILDRDGELVFRRDSEETGGVSQYTIPAEEERESEGSGVEALEAASWVLSDDEMPAPAGPQRSRRGSAASVMTIWPGAEGGKPAAEVDEFGHEIEGGEVKAPGAAHLLRNRLADPSEFELVEVDLEEGLAGPSSNPWNTQREEQRRRYAAEIPNERPHRNLTEVVSPSSYYSSK